MLKPIESDRAPQLRKELIQVANVALTWASILPREQAENG